MNKKNSIVFIIMLLTFSSVCSQEWVWPTSASKWLTSTFAEVRPRRYHAGWDVKTWGKEGYPVFAMQDGYIWRIKTSPTGYGNVVYIKHPTGYYSVYAHLSGFFKQLNDFVRKHQLETNEYIQQFYFSSHQFPVKKGDIIGYSGSTGIGYPHLHFEIRSSLQQPLNPAYFFKNMVKDNFYPVVKSISFIPEDFGTTINGNSLPTVYNEFKLEKHNYRLVEIPIISGPFSISIYAYDRMRPGFNRIFYQKSELYIDNMLISSLEYDSLKYEYNHHVELERNYYFKRHGQKRFQNFAKNKHFKLPFYKIVRNNGIISDLKDGEHILKIKIWDIKNNLTTLSGKFYFLKKKPQIKLAAKNDSSFLQIESPFAIGNATISHLYKKSPLSSGPEHSLLCASDSSVELRCPISATELKYYAGSKIKLYPINSDALITLFYINPYLPYKPDCDSISVKTEEFQVWYQFKLQNKELIFPPDNFTVLQNSARLIWTQISPSAATLTVHKEYFLKNKSLVLSYGKEKIVLEYPQTKVFRGETKEINATDSLFSLLIKDNTLYDSLYINIGIDSSGNFPRQNSVCAPVYDLYSRNVSLRNSAEIYFVLDSIKDRTGIFPAYLDLQKNDWFFLPYHLTSDSSVIYTNILSMEKFTICRDTVPPEIAPLNFTDNDTIQIKDLTLKVKDEFSGIFKMNQIEVYLNGSKHLFEYDPEMDYIKIPAYSLSRNSINLKIRVTDNAGNIKENEYQLQLM